MKGSISKKESFKKQAKIPKYEKYKLKNPSNILVMFFAGFVILIAIVWIITGFGLGISYYLFKSNHYIWASMIVLFDFIILRSFVKRKI